MTRETRERKARQAKFNRTIAFQLAVFGLLAVAIVLATPDPPARPIKLGPLPTTPPDHPECPDWYAQHPDWDAQHGDAPCGIPHSQPPTTTAQWPVEPYTAIPSSTELPDKNDPCLRSVGPASCPTQTIPWGPGHEEPLPPPRTTTTPTTPNWSVYCYQHPENKPECGPATPTTSLPYSPNGCPANGHPWCSNPTATENPEGPSAASCVSTETVSCGPGFGPGAPAWTTPTPRTWATPTDHQRGAVGSPGGYRYFTLAMHQDIAKCCYRHHLFSFKELKSVFRELPMADYSDTSECQIPG
jgi:hypothetical protein